MGKGPEQTTHQRRYRDGTVRRCSPSAVAGDGQTNTRGRRSRLLERPESERLTASDAGENAEQFLFLADGIATSLGNATSGAATLEDSAAFS